MKGLNLSHVQNFNPIYERIFALNQTNWNDINLNHDFFIKDIKDTKQSLKEIDELDDTIVLSCVLGQEHGTKINETKKKVFVKLAPLLDPYKYIVGKYDHANPQLFQLPSLSNFDTNVATNVHEKISDPNNSSYIDSFFSYLSGQVFHKHQFIHGICHYGSFLAIKKNFKIDIMDDLEYLVQSPFFKQQQNILFQVDDYSHLVKEEEFKRLKPLVITTVLDNVDMDIVDIDVVDIVDVKTDKGLASTDQIEHVEEQEEQVEQEEQIQETTDGIHLASTDQDQDQDQDQEQDQETNSSGSLSSRTSHTNSDDTYTEDEQDDDEQDDKQDKDMNQNKDDDKDDDKEDDNWVTDSDGSCTNSSDEYDETIMATLPVFPVQLICLEKCENTFDWVIANNEWTEEEMVSALMQIIMNLLVYQKMFAFTHNDLHTCNIMFVPTKESHLYYKYKTKTYKVPTYGKIYKLIDFGRAIYSFNGKLFCSDSFKPQGDAAGQYNTPPYYSAKHPRIDPNNSFDLCRLACSMFDYVLKDFKKSHHLETCTPIERLIVEWCLDDKGINVLYKKNGADRYPDFKLYKMIAKCVHHHTPEAQLSRPMFSKYIVDKIDFDAKHVMNIDEYPCLV